jgi:hypothetical protein
MGNILQSVEIKIQKTVRVKNISNYSMKKRKRKSNKHEVLKKKLMREFSHLVVERDILS